MLSEVCVLSEDASLASGLAEPLADERLVVEPTCSGQTAVRRALCGCSSVMLIDEEPSDMAAADVLRRLRSGARGRETLVVILSSKASEIDRVIAFELGADDFVSKPIGLRELALRLAAVARRHRDERSRNTELRAGPFFIDPRCETALCRGEPLRLTSVEFRLLEHLARHAGQVQPRQELLARVWRWCDVNGERNGGSRTVDTHVKRLREKLGPESQFIETIRGVGYRLRTAS